jgi:hypothetical protein
LFSIDSNECENSRNVEDCKCINKHGLFSIDLIECEISRNDTSPWSRFELTTTVVIGTNCIGSCKSNYHMITATTAPFHNLQHFLNFYTRWSQYQTSHVYLLIYNLTFNSLCPALTLKINLISPWYSWKIAELVLNNNHSTKKSLQHAWSMALSTWAHTWLSLSPIPSSVLCRKFQQMAVKVQLHLFTHLQSDL